MGNKTIAWGACTFSENIKQVTWFAGTPQAELHKTCSVTFHESDLGEQVKLQFLDGQAEAVAGARIKKDYDIKAIGKMTEKPFQTKKGLTVLGHELKDVEKLYFRPVLEMGDDEIPGDSGEWQEVIIPEKGMQNYDDFHASQVEKSEKKEKAGAIKGRE